MTISKEALQWMQTVTSTPVSIIFSYYHEAWKLSDPLLALL